MEIGAEKRKIYEIRETLMPFDGLAADLNMKKPVSKNGTEF